jgi:aryl-alcohol dehydrogenase-like predicted oxidoreductase
LSELDVADRVVMVTKVRALTPVELADPVSATRAIEQSVAESRRRLRIDCLPVVLFHHEADARYLNVLERLKEKGWLRHAGVSGDNRPGPAPGWIAAGTVAALQLPGNILDRRHQRTGVFRQAAERDVAIFIRSVYLQGLLVMPEDLIPPALRGIIPIRRRLTALAGDAGMSWSELALRYMLTQTGVTCILTGVDTLAQVLENIALFERGPLAADIVAAADAVVPDLPETILTPALWPRSSPP